MADSAIAITGGNIDTRTASNGDHRQVITIGDSATDNMTLVNADNELYVRQRPADLGVTVTAAANTATTLTLPAVAGRFHYITYLELTLYNTAARTGGATPVLVTSTNIPGSPVWTFASAGAVGTTETRVLMFDAPVKSTTVNTATTIVGPATSNLIWRFNVRYYAGL